eukprot:13748064-Ditylum_brightwellii.AAC.1
MAVWLLWKMPLHSASAANQTTDFIVQHLVCPTSFVVHSVDADCCAPSLLRVGRIVGSTALP